MLVSRVHSYVFPFSVFCVANFELNTVASSILRSSNVHNIIHIYMRIGAVHRRWCCRLYGNILAYLLYHNMFREFLGVLLRVFGLPTQDKVLFDTFANIPYHTARTLFIRRLWKSYLFVVFRYGSDLFLLDEWIVHFCRWLRLYLCGCLVRVSCGAFLRSNCYHILLPR